MAAHVATYSLSPTPIRPRSRSLERGLDYLERDPTAHALAGTIVLFAASERSRSGTELYELYTGFPKSAMSERCTSELRQISLSGGRPSSALAHLTSAWHPVATLNGVAGFMRWA